MNPPLLQAEKLSKTYVASSFGQKPQKPRPAVANLSFTLEAGQTMALVGESGCGKSTAARLLLRLTTKDHGRCLYRGQDLYALPRKELQALRPKLQMVFQDPLDSLSPRMTVLAALREGVRQHHIVPKEQEQQHLLDALESCGLPSQLLNRYPCQLSGGQRQRLSIAKALVLQPELLILDEPLSALDVSVQAQILNLLYDLGQSRNLTYLLISHDLPVVECIAQKVGVMYQGRLLEIGATRQIFTAPSHPYTQALLAAAGNPVTIPAPLGQNRDCCPIAHWCSRALPLCHRKMPPLSRMGAADHSVACYFQ